MKKVEWKVEGMTCTNCALTISNYLQQAGAQHVAVSFISGEVNFDLEDSHDPEILSKGMASLGYRVIDEAGQALVKNRFLSNHLQRFLFCLPFTLLLMLHMLPWHMHWLMNPWLQLLICLPVWLTGLHYFGRSAVRSIVKGIPNMNVLISLGSTAAFIYSLLGTIGHYGENYLFYETTATIITLIFLGEWMEEKTIKITRQALDQLAQHQKVMANMIAFDGDHQEMIFPVENTQLHVGDLVLIKSGEQVPADSKILWGEAQVSEALLTGESTPIKKTAKDRLLGGSILTNGMVKAQVTAVGKDTVLGNLLYLVKQAQAVKPPVQQLADKISAVFVPVVIGLSVLTFLLTFFVAHLLLATALMRSIAVLVIACPCAMGLATPAAIAVGLGRAAKNGILFRDAKSLEMFRQIGIVIFDKTGTLTKGDICITSFHLVPDAVSEETFKSLVFSMEKYSGHPIAKAVVREWKNSRLVSWERIEEIKGVGIIATGKDGNHYQLGAAQWLRDDSTDRAHTAYLFKNGMLLGWLDAEDAIRPEAKEVIDYLHSKNIRTCLLSGDHPERCKKVADALGIQEWYAGKSPEAKLRLVEELNRTLPVAMVGDGINDAPALAKATIGISMSEATQIAVQNAQVILMNHGIRRLPLALGLGKQTYATIRSNLFWAFLYNIFAIPVAALGWLNPGVAALAMGLSDVVLAFNSIRLYYRKVI